MHERLRVWLGAGRIGTSLAFFPTGFHTEVSLMKNRKRLLLPVAFASACLLFAGCGATLTQLRTRAAFDFDCQADSISVREMDPGTRVAAGCGKQAVYVENYNQNLRPVWMLNSEVKSQPEKTASTP
jgi:hypothetical protein